MDFPQRKVIRKKGYDYTSEGAYFITICTKDREQYFGKIKDSEMILNELGQYTWECRKEIPKHFGLVGIGEFICMPDHIHGILIIRRDAIMARPNHTQVMNMITTTDNISNNDRTARNAVPTNISIGSKYGSVGYIINQFKGTITKFAKNKNIQFLWQSRFYDRIIKDEQEFQTIKKYIQDNPKNRGKDENYL